MERARAPAHLCVCVYRGAFLPAGEPGLGLLPVSLQPHAPALRVPSSAPHLALSPGSSSLPHFTNPRSPALSRQGPHPTLPPGPAAALKALEDRGRCVRHQMSAGLASKSSSWKVPEGTSGHGEGPAQGDACASSQAGIGRPAGAHRPGQLSKHRGAGASTTGPSGCTSPSQGPLVPYRQQVLTKLPRETHTHRATPPSA